uniref:G-patch domain-containing protein n=1 Tax=Ditylenchus dipsaci TaxID=166011 RepID=A0A915D106_9BILA
MSHLFFDPNKQVDFVRASTNDISDQVPSTSYQSISNYTGEEAKEFYESLVMNEQSSSRRNSRATEDAMLSGSFLSSPSAKSRSEKPPPLTERDSRLFLKAAAEGDLASVKLFCKRGIDIEVEDMFRWTALMCAASADQVDCSGRTAASLAEKNGHFWIAGVIEKCRSEKNDDKLSDSMNKKCQLNKGFCTICQRDYTGDNHESSMVHMIHSGQLPSEGYAYGISQSNKGYQMLKSRGWSEKLGLGKNNEGRKYPIKTILKRDTKGLGMHGTEKSRKKVTHFEPFDVRAVESVQTQLSKGQYFKRLDKKKRKNVISRSLSSNVE